MKRVMSLCLAVLLAVAIVGCGPKATEKKPDAAAKPAATQAT